MATREGESGASAASAEAYAQSVREELEKLAATIAAGNADSAKDVQDIVFVAGNEAGDMDSIVSALGVALAFGRSGGAVPAPTEQQQRTLFMPMVNFTRSEFRLRGDSKLVFQQAGFKMDNEGAPVCLLFREEVARILPALQQAVAKPCGIVLTDHNVLTMALLGLFSESHVRGIVDHHTDENRYTDLPEEVRIVRPGVGSACTLAAEMLHSRNVSIPADLGLLLYSTILIDVRNFNPEAKRFNDKDEAVFPKLRSFAPAPPEAEADSQLWWFKRISEARLDVAGLSSADLMRIDHKQVDVSGRAIGVSSVPVTVLELVKCSGSLAQLLVDAEEFARQSELQALILLTKSTGAAPSPVDDKPKGLILLDLFSTPGIGAKLISVLQETPKSLPKELLESALFKDQGIDEAGLGLHELDVAGSLKTEQAEPASGARSLQFFTLRKQITRKTLLPSVVSILQHQFKSISDSAAAL